MPSLSDPWDVVTLLNGIAYVNKQLINQDLTEAGKLLARRLLAQVQPGSGPPIPVPPPLSGQLFGFSGPYLWGPVAGNPNPDLDLLAADGFGLIRTDVLWRDIETSQGVYNQVKLDALDALVNGAVARGIKPILAVLGTPGWANGGQDFNVFPTDGWLYTNFVRSLADRYAPHTGQVIWEVWNEPNHPNFWTPTNALLYAFVVRDLGRSLHTDHPGSVVLAGSVVFNDAFRDSFLWEVANGGWPDAFDGLSIHPYTLNFTEGPMHLAPANSGYESCILAMLNAQTALATHGMADKPIWITEIGWATTNLTPEARSAHFAELRQMIVERPWIAGGVAYTIHSEYRADMAMLNTPSYDAWRGL